MELKQEEDRAEKVEQLERSTAGLVEVLRKTRKEIAALLIEGENLRLEDLMTKHALYDKTWKQQR